MVNDVAAKGIAGKAVVNMSLGGPKSTAMNNAVAALSRAGVMVVVAAGNENVSLAIPFKPH